MANAANCYIPPRNRSTWVQTYLGKQCYPLNPRPDDIEIEDIAHALSLQNRYSGHTKFPLSIAQHSVLASYYCAEYPFEALMHDSSEAYLVDVPRPIKKFLQNYVFYEDRLMKCIARKFGFQWPLPAVVKDIDLVLLATERRDCMASPPIPWMPTASVIPFPEKIKPWTWKRAKREFLKRFEILRKDK